MDRSMILAKYELGNLLPEDSILDEIFIRAFMIFHRGKELRLDESTVFYFGVKFFRWFSVELDLDENLYMICCDIFVAKENPCRILDYREIVFYDFFYCEGIFFIISNRISFRRDLYTYNHSRFFIQTKDCMP